MLYFGRFTAIFLAFWLVYVVVTRRYFHPLSRVPGPPLWAVSSLPLLYYQGIKEGRVPHMMRKLHATYGPIVRISPNEVHLSDPDDYVKIYSMGGRKFLKDPGFYSAMDEPVNTPDTPFLTVLSSEVHRVRRGRINPFFSRRSILDLEILVRNKARKLCDMIQTRLDSGPAESFDLHHALRAYIVDLITEYAYATCWNQLDEEDFGAWYQEAIRAIQTMFVWFQTFPFCSPIFGLIPDWVNIMMVPPFKKWYETLRAVQKSIEQVREEVALDIKPPRRTIFHELIDPLSERGNSKFESPSNATVFADAVILTGAGADTVGGPTERAIFEVINNPDVYRTLTAELREAFPKYDDMNITALEKLPYLNGVIKESLRINPGVPGRLPRVVPEGGATFHGHSLPVGTVVSMSAWVQHHNMDMFPNPDTFDPTRWIGVGEEVRARERCLVPFSKGIRNCVGQTLAMIEIYYGLGAIFHRFDDLQVHPNFGPEDLVVVDLLIGYHPKRARKFHVMKRAPTATALGC
ncbi:cytochrome P450 [Thozetella sp. PMI_491]|nr:cytochrome P450 [Thozetella sp. PMI_491]